MSHDHLQSIFDRVYLHLTSQGMPCYDARADQLRLRLGALTSAIGSLIRPEYYSEALEGQPVATSQLLRRALRESGIPADQVRVRRLLMQLEEVHDQVNPLRWLRELARASPPITSWPLGPTPTASSA